MTYTQQPHPAESDLALYAAGDLRWLHRRRTDRHVSRCSQCQGIVAEYSEFRSSIKSSQAFEAPNWNRLASEMTANIRLGLAAGECVGARLAPRPIVSGKRLILAGGMLSALVAVGIWIGRPDLHPVQWQKVSSGTILERSETGIQVSGIRQTLRIMNPATRNVIYSVGSQGELRARSLDPETGNVAITHVYGE